MQHFVDCIVIGLANTKSKSPPFPDMKLILHANSITSDILVTFQKAHTSVVFEYFLLYTTT